MVLDQPEWFQFVFAVFAALLLLLLSERSIVARQRGG